MSGLRERERDKFDVHKITSLALICPPLNPELGVSFYLNIIFVFEIVFYIIYYNINDNIVNIVNFIMSVVITIQNWSDYTWNILILICSLNYYNVIYYVKIFITKFEYKYGYF